MLRRHPNPDAPIRLFGFPYAGGTAKMFNAIATGVGSAVEVCAVEYPGRGLRFGERLFTSVPALVVLTVATACAGLSFYTELRYPWRWSADEDAELERAA